MDPNFLQSCRKELSGLVWIWWIVLCGLMPGRQVLKCSVVRPQSPLLSLPSLGDPVAAFQACFVSPISEGLVHPISQQILSFLTSKREVISPEISLALGFFFLVPFV